MRNERLRGMIHAAFFAALLGIFAQVTIELPLVPLTMQTFGVLLTGIILGPKLGFVAMIVYLALGSIGVPVFAQLGSGIDSFVSPSGGFLMSYPFAVFVIAALLHGIGTTVVRAHIACLAGTVIIYAFAVVHYMIFSGVTLGAALATMVIPFIVGDLIKLVLACVAGVQIRKRLILARLLPDHSTTKVSVEKVA